jgi:hypothetical protein
VAPKHQRGISIYIQYVNAATNLTEISFNHCY